MAATATANDGNLAELAASLHRLERAVLPHLEKHSSVIDVIAASKMQEVEVLRALHWLQNKGAVKITEQITEVVSLSKEAEAYLTKGLPEVRFLHAIKDTQLALTQIKKTTGLSDEEVGASIGILARLKAIEQVQLAGGKGFKITEHGKQLTTSGLPTQQFFTRLPQGRPLSFNELSAVEKVVAAELKKRSLVNQDVVKNRTALLTDLGKEVLKKASASAAAETVDRLTPEMLVTGKWKGTQFRPYDLTTPAPRVFFGRLQPYREFLEEVREKFVALGFEEMTGPIVESEFWNMDALFMPQFHSARDIHDVYCIKEPKFATDLPQQLVKKVKAAHEDGFGTGSKGWRYEFDEGKTARLIMRSQTTACSARKLASAGLKIPGKYFAIGRCFRYDVIDAKHLADFNQVEGIVAEKGMSLRHLIGLLKLFAREFCSTDQVRVVPSYFPFTEPSAALYAKHPQLGWIELAGAGLFRPEMVKPLTGKDIPVIAWGIGIDRIAMFKLKLDDIRELFSHDLNFLRSAKVI